ncbi:MAG TPA: hypothetical protein PKJ41_11380 [Bryobacteraceae bacterium]|nr:hypothetical protein [Bryobacteraceae bacterium]
MPTFISRITGHDSNRRRRLLAWLGLAPALLGAQSLPPEVIPGEEDSRGKRMPDGRSMSEAILKEDHKRNLADLGKMKEIIAEVERSLEKNAQHVLSIDNLKRLEEVERLSRRVRGRMRRI